MSANSVVHTGPNTQFGGASAGFTSEPYHDSRPLTVNTAPEAPTTSQARIARPSETSGRRRGKLAASTSKKLYPRPRVG
jgi:hypothetical protein